MKVILHSQNSWPHALAGTQGHRRCPAGAAGTQGHQHCPAGGGQVLASSHSASSWAFCALSPVPFCSSLFLSLCHNFLSLNPFSCSSFLLPSPLCFLSSPVHRVSILGYLHTLPPLVAVQFSVLLGPEPSSSGVQEEVQKPPQNHPLPSSHPCPSQLFRRGGPGILDVPTSERPGICSLT